jgi:hypothetical protein
MTADGLRMMMLDIDGILTRHEATATDVLAAAQALATSAVGDLTNAVIKREESQVRLDYPEREQGRADRLNKGTDQTDALHRFADLAADQIRAALHKRIDEGPKPDW